MAVHGSGHEGFGEGAGLDGVVRRLLFYYAVVEGGGAPAGKALFGLRVAGPDRNPPGFGRALLRALVYVCCRRCPIGWAVD